MRMTGKSGAAQAQEQGQALGGPAPTVLSAPKSPEQGTPGAQLSSEGG